MHVNNNICVCAAFNCRVISFLLWRSTARIDMLVIFFFTLCTRLIKCWQRKFYWYNFLDMRRIIFQMAGRPPPPHYLIIWTVILFSIMNVVYFVRDQNLHNFVISSTFFSNICLLYMQPHNRMLYMNILDGLKCECKNIQNESEHFLVFFISFILKYITRYECLLACKCFINLNLNYMPFSKIALCVFVV